jgi:DNA repair protein RecO (recombination protein O)
MGKTTFRSRMITEKAEGIVLRSLEYRDRQRIITLFTKEEGIISLIVKHISSKRSTMLALTTPFTRGEYLYRRGRSELMPLEDATLLDEHLELRNRFESLQAAGELVQAILASQMPGKAAPILYGLFSAYLKQIAHFPKPDSAICSFLLKILKHEGLIAWDHLSAFRQEEQEIVKQLLIISSFNQLREHSIPSDFSTKIRSYFKTTLTH